MVDLMVAPSDDHAMSAMLPTHRMHGKVKPLLSGNKSNSRCIGTGDTGNGCYHAMATNQQSRPAIPPDVAPAIAPAPAAINTATAHWMLKFCLRLWFRKQSSLVGQGGARRPQIQRARPLGQ